MSVHFKRPSWQTPKIPSANHGAIDGRIVPDVVANASANTGYFTVVDGQAGISGGTSAAAPLWAALIARMNQNLSGGKHVGYLSPLLYKAVPGGTATLGSVGLHRHHLGQQLHRGRRWLLGPGRLRRRLRLGLAQRGGPACRIDEDDLIGTRRFGAIAFDLRSEIPNSESRISDQYPD